MPWNRLTGGSSALTALVTSTLAGARAGDLNAEVLGDRAARLRTAVSRTDSIPELDVCFAVGFAAFFATCFTVRLAACFVRDLSGMSRIRLGAADGA